MPALRLQKHLRGFQRRETQSSAKTALTRSWLVQGERKQLRGVLPVGLLPRQKLPQQSQRPQAKEKGTLEQKDNKEACVPGSEPAILSNGSHPESDDIAKPAANADNMPDTPAVDV
ncbi:hypothetical protein HPB52_006698 [Rhipicephalus sanguineus]|uniref:Uncharacterized protein n=1 Tax=Rhipicephalus sanguineus TaxID=34632 RepID=A0A9D4PUV7_RHISA|nr:hypothetical protein HPB52_006698 [Rhipicephalus sanguineus]